MSELTESQMIQELKKYDTATICNVVATYPGSDICLKLYDAWRGEYYTDQTLRCMYPEIGPVCGYAATAWYSEASDSYTTLDPWSLPDHFEAIKKPIILVAKQTFPPDLVNLAGLFGGNMTIQFKAQGVICVVTDGPMRDYEEIRGMKVQYLATGLTSGHGKLAVRGVNIPIKVAGMTIAPGDIIHADVCGACKFPADRLSNVLEYATELVKRETKQQKMFKDPNFTLAQWKATVKNKEVKVP